MWVKFRMKLTFILLIFSLFKEHGQYLLMILWRLHDWTLAPRVQLYKYIPSEGRLDLTENKQLLLNTEDWTEICIAFSKPSGLRHFYEPETLKASLLFSRLMVVWAFIFLGRFLFRLHTGSYSVSGTSVVSSRWSRLSNKLSQIQLENIKILILVLHVHSCFECLFLFQLIFMKIIRQSFLIVLSFFIKQCSWLLESQSHLLSFCFIVT